MINSFLWGQDQKNVVLQDVWNDTTITLGVEDARFSDVWGFYQNGNRYCALGSTEGVEIFSVTADKLSWICQRRGAFEGFTVVHRDMKTYDDYLYVVGDEGTATLQIFDLSYLPDSISKVYDSNALFGICHNIFIDSSTAKLYACGPNNLGMKVIDITNPVAPMLLVDFNIVAYVHDCYVKNDTAFLNCGQDGLHIYDFSGTIPIQLGVLDFYANQGYNHSGWMSASGDHYAFIDETKGTKVKLCELNDLASIQIDELFGTDEFQDYTAHNVFVLENLAFVAYYNEGLRIYDISKKPIKEIAHFDTFEDETLYTQNGAWGVYVFEDENQILIADRQNGLHLFSFPIDLFESGNTGTYISSTPFIDASSKLLPRDNFEMDNLKFSISALDGSIVYLQENYKNWVDIPLSLRAGAYMYGIYTSDGDLLESGKFVKAN